MEFLVASLDAGETFAPDGKRFENMQILGFVTADSILDARKKFFTENEELLLHGYGSKFALKFYVCEDSEYPKKHNNFFKYSVQQKTMYFWGESIGCMNIPLEEEYLVFLKKESD